MSSLEIVFLEKLALNSDCFHGFYCLKLGVHTCLGREQLLSVAVKKKKKKKKKEKKEKCGLLFFYTLHLVVLSIFIQKKYICFASNSSCSGRTT